MKSAVEFLKYGGQALSFAALFAAVSPAFAETVTKPFEFGAGTANPTSVSRTFRAPCGRDIVVTVEHYVNDLTSKNDVPISIILAESATPADTQGSAVDGKNATVTRNKQTATLGAAYNQNRSVCSLPWIVRIKAQSGQPPVAVKGSITFWHDSQILDLLSATALIALNKSSSATKNIGSPNGLGGQGRVVVTGTWDQALGPIPGPFPVKLRFQLIDPNGRIVAGDDGYSNDETESCCSGDKMKIVFDTASCPSGQWKIRITNVGDYDAMNIDPKVKITFICPS